MGSRSAIGVDRRVETRRPVTNDLEPAYGPYSEADKASQAPQRYPTLMLPLAGTTRATHQRTEGVGARSRCHSCQRPRADTVGLVSGRLRFTDRSRCPDTKRITTRCSTSGILRQNDIFWQNVHDAQTMLKQLRDGTLPAQGIFYIKGSSQNGFGWKPANPDPYVQANWLGDDDHPGSGDTDAQIGQRFVATFVNAIARSKYWSDSAIVVTWDDPGGYYDHVPPPQFSACPDQKPCGDGPRLPFILISPVRARRGHRLR